MNELRSEMKAKRSALSTDEVTALSTLITNRVLTLDLKDYNSVFIYRSFKNEVDTNRLIAYFLSQNKKLAYPVIKGDIMVAGAPKTSGENHSKFGTVEPTLYQELNDIDICFVPLIATDKNKNRIGFGKGYYDKFLKTHPCLKIGLCYDFQVVENITPNPWDIPLDIIVTESKIIK
ncbi:MAG: 5-formyltetrahydrofolate cyclo-ligase [Clostridia bacterium]|nr:5-formyltetrahydrofolate cyclo-ligase [Clostridia bacterium]